MGNTERFNDPFSITYSSDSELKNSLASAEQKNYFVNPAIITQNTEEEKISENGVEYITHLGFNNINDLDEYIKELEKEIDLFKIRWTGTKEKQGLNERLEELSIKIDQKTRIYSGMSVAMVEPEFEALQKEYEELLKLQQKELETVKDKLQKINELTAARKRWVMDSRARFKPIINDKSKVSEQLIKAEEELKKLYAKIYAGKDSQFVKDRIAALENEIIIYLENKDKNYHEDLGFGKK